MRNCLPICVCESRQGLQPMIGLAALMAQAIRHGKSEKTFWSHHLLPQPPFALKNVELIGIEPTTSSLRTTRSSN